ncbi:MAG: nodulation protein NfeD [Bacillota bacterium]
MKKGQWGRVITVLLLSILWLVLPVQSQQPASPVYVLPVKGTVDGGMSVFINKSYAEAEENNAAAVILEIDTPGGFVWSAKNIRDTIHRSPVPTIAFVQEGAISAGVLIAIVSETLVMAPGSTMGAAEPQIGGQRADPKTLSYWVGQLEAAAEETGRDELVARAMADADVEIPGLVARGELLTLTPKKALELGMIDNILPDRQSVLEEYGLADNPIIEKAPAFGEFFASWITHPYVSTILLTLGIAGLVLEIFTVGFGIPGTIGLAALSLYFAGHIFVGLTGFEAVLLFILGVVLLAVEAIFIPGFGLAGLGGIAALTASVIIASPSVGQGVTSLVIAIIGTVVLLAVSIKFLPTRRVWKRLVLGDRQLREEGYNAPQTELRKLVGLEGTAITPLRPAGAVQIGDNRVDVVTNGSFIPSGSNVKVIKVEGTRVVVELKKQEQ